MAEVGLSLVIPLYRDEDALQAIFERCEPILRGAAGGGELVLVDDGGLDRTTPRARELAREYPHPVVVVRLARNFGQHPAVFAGLAHARGAARGDAGQRSPVPARGDPRGWLPSSQRTCPWSPVTEPIGVTRSYAG